MQTKQHTITLVQRHQMAQCLVNGFGLDGLFVCHIGYMRIDGFGGVLWGLGLMEAAVNSKVLHSRTSRSPYHTKKTELKVSSTIFTRDNVRIVIYFQNYRIAVIFVLRSLTQ